MTIFYILIVLAFTFLLHMYIEAKNPKTSTLNLKAPKYIKTINILHLSDIHINVSPFSWRKVVRCVEKAKPDLILLSGDYFDDVKSTKNFVKFMQTINPTQKPVYACLGNHDIAAFVAEKNPFTLDRHKLSTFLQELKDSGIHILDNQSVCPLPDTHQYLKIVGVSDLSYELDNIKNAFASVNNNDFNIVIGHNPDLIFKLPQEKTSLFLCGHFHGGQIWMPFNIEYKLLRREALAKENITKGLNLVRQIQIYINRGLGCVIFPLRFFSPPEILVIKINADHPTKE